MLLIVIHLQQVGKMPSVKKLLEECSKPPAGGCLRGLSAATMDGECIERSSAVRMRMLVLIKMTSFGCFVS